MKRIALSLIKKCSRLKLMFQPPFPPSFPTSFILSSPSNPYSSVADLMPIESVINTLMKLGKLLTSGIDENRNKQWYKIYETIKYTA
jgi:hypothetical protein